MDYLDGCMGFKHTQTHTRTGFPRGSTGFLGGYVGFLGGDMKFHGFLGFYTDFLGGYMGFLSDNKKTCGNMVSPMVILISLVVIWLQQWLYWFPRV